MKCPTNLTWALALIKMTKFNTVFFLIIFSTSCFGQRCLWIDVLSNDSIYLQANKLEIKPKDGFWKIENIYGDTNLTAFVEILDQKPEYFKLQSNYGNLISEGNYFNDTIWTFYFEDLKIDTTYKVGNWYYFLTRKPFKIPYNRYGEYTQYLRHPNGHLKKEIIYKKNKGNVAEIYYNNEGIPESINNSQYNYSLTYPFYFHSYRYKIEGWIDYDTTHEYGITTPMIRFKNANLLLDTNAFIEEIIYSKKGKHKRIEIDK
jgi:hypothetical protein